MYQYLRRPRRRQPPHRSLLIRPEGLGQGHALERRVEGRVEFVPLSRAQVLRPAAEAALAQEDGAHAAAGLDRVEVDVFDDGGALGGRELDLGDICTIYTYMYVPYIHVCVHISPRYIARRWRAWRA